LKLDQITGTLLERFCMKCRRSALKANRSRVLSVGGLIAACIFALSSMWPIEADGCSPPPEYKAESFEGDHPDCLEFNAIDVRRTLFEIVNFCDSQVRLEALECQLKDCDRDCDRFCGPEAIAVSDGGRKRVLADDLGVDGGTVAEGETINVRLGWSTATEEGITDVEVYHRDISGSCDIGGCGCGRGGIARAIYPMVLVPLFVFAARRRSM
jgi:hypothetical protein